MTKLYPAWLSDAVFYQIYPPSFYDSNGDGIGDIKGIIARLDYLQWLGVNAIWLNPCFASPFRDGGYDISDYYRVAPRYGTNVDLRRLFRAAERRGIRVILDLVPGHTSVDHPWFRQSCRAQRNKYTDRYIWTDQGMDFRRHDLRTVNGYAERDGSYVTNFFWSQPALNYGFAKPTQLWQLPVTHPACQATRRELMKIMRYWLDAGAAGFRVDMASSIVKNDPGHRQTIAWWREVRAMLDAKYPQAMLISEWSNPAAALRAGFHSDFLLPWENPCHKLLLGARGPGGASDQPAGFLDRRGRGDITAFLDVYLDCLRQCRGRGFMSLMTGNHDLVRLRQGRTMAELEVIFAVLLTLPGIPFIYYGDEIGMKHLDLPNKEGGYFRTGARTPMQWDGSRNAGFSTAPKGKLYLPVDPAKNHPTVAGQQENSNSLLQHVRDLIALRRKHPALSGEGEFAPIYARKQACPFVYLRRKGRERFLVAINPANKPARARFDAKLLQSGKPLAPKKILVATGDQISIDMGPVSYAIMDLTDSTAGR
ncbi:MAG: hypothetical protein JW709_05455 [Sedimentisphaerales bacterium]|nr:hypothetical protein [Sedimentisphaerales bacterium]